MNCSKCKRLLPETHPFKRCDHCRSVVTGKSIRYYHGIREKLFTWYGGKCVCCGESNIYFLTLDHIGNDGHEDRKERGDKGLSIYKDIYKSGKIREDLQLLCANCNLGKMRNKGVCPHQGLIDRTGPVVPFDDKIDKRFEKSTVCTICGKPRVERGKSRVARCWEHYYMTAEEAANQAAVK